MRVRFGNSTTFDSDMAMEHSVYVKGEKLKSTFVICPTLNPSLIIGRPLLRLLNFLPRVPVQSNEAEVYFCAASLSATSLYEPNVQSRIDYVPWIETVPYKQGKRLVARFPLLEQSMLEPIREPIRSRNPTSERIILARLIQMCDEDSVQECNLEDIPAVIPVVLIDKRPHKPRVFPDTEVHDRYRITYDLRGYNKLNLVTSDSGQFALVPKHLSSLSEHDKRRKYVDQFQRSSFEILRKIPMKFCVYFSKIDIANAYNCVALSTAMQHVGTEVYDSDTGHYRYFKCTTLCQGWRYSPTFFRMCANFLVQKCLAAFDGVHDNVHIDFFQDDILLCSNNKIDLTTATHKAMSILLDYSLRVRPDKMVVATEEIVFCGYLLKAGSCRPNPTRRQLTHSLAESMWADLIMAPGEESIVKWIRSFAGMCQYLYGFLGPNELRQLQQLYLLSSQNPSDITKCRDSFTTLVSYITQGLPFMCLGSVAAPELYCTLIISDANKDSWASIVLKVIRNDYCPQKTNLFSQADFGDLLSQVSSKLGIEYENSCIVPVRICGDRFPSSMRKQSSTFRERSAVLLTLGECRSLLEGPVIVVTDNRNCQLEWHNIETLGASLIQLWQLYCEVVISTIWLPRDSYPSLADFVARFIGRDYAATTTTDCGVVEICPGEADLTSALPLAYSSDETQFFDVCIRYIFRKTLQG
jgi:hypothetical protein